jgi:hypothetical protein
MARSTRRARPRPSVVVTFAATASLLACGGQLNGDNGSGGDGGTDSNPAACPAAAPAYGSACEGSMACNYPGCDPSLTITFECRSGAWKQTGYASCNPPMPTCPTSEPALGSSCTAPGYCSYSDTCADRPATAPTDGFDHLSCVGGKWTLADDYVASCPKTAPADGASCACGLHRYSGTCTYSTGCSFGVGDTIAMCSADASNWTIGHATCNPPGPDGGPIDVGDPPPPTDAGSSEAGGAEASPGDAGPGI